MLTNIKCYAHIRDNTKIYSRPNSCLSLDYIWASLQSSDKSNELISVILPTLTTSTYEGQSHLIGNFISQTDDCPANTASEGFFHDPSLSGSGHTTQPSKLSDRHTCHIKATGPNTTRSFASQNPWQVCGVFKLFFVMNENTTDMRQLVKVVCVLICSKIWGKLWWRR